MKLMLKVIHIAALMTVTLTYLGMLIGGVRYLLITDSVMVSQVSVRGNQIFSAQHILRLLELQGTWDDMNPLELASHFEHAIFKQVMIRKIYP